MSCVNCGLSEDFSLNVTVYLPSVNNNTTQERIERSYYMCIGCETQYRAGKFIFYAAWETNELY